MVAYLEKSEENKEFHQIVDFLSTCSITYALTVSPTIYAFYIEQFWNTATSKTVNYVKQIHAIVDGKVVVISESSMRNDLLFNDEDGITCLTNDEIFANLTLMGNLDPKKFLMYPRFLQLFLNNQLKDLPEPFNDTYETPCHTKKVFTNMARKGVNFLGKVTPLFDSMLVQHQAPKSEGLAQPTEPQPTPSPAHPSPRDQPYDTNLSSRPEHTHSPSINLEGTGGSQWDQVQIPYDSPLSGGHTSDRVEGGLNLEELFVLCTNLSNRVLALESTKDAQAAEILKLITRIKKLEKKCKPSISHHKAWLRSVSQLSMKKNLDKKESLDDLVDEGADYDVNEESIAGKTLSAATLAVNTASVQEASINTARIVSTADIISTIVPPNPDVAGPSNQDDDQYLFDDETRIADILVNIASARPRPVVITEPKQEQRRTTPSVQHAIDPIDKSKGKMVEPEPTKKLKKRGLDAAQITRDEEVVRQLEVQWQAELERERQRADQASVDYIANLYDEVQAKIDANFVPIGSEEDKRRIIDINKKDEDESSDKGEVDYEVLDKRYPIVDWESKFYHTDRYGEPHDYYRVFRDDRSSRYIKTFTKMVLRFYRLDFIKLHSLVMQRFETTTPEGIDLVLWGDLRTMFEENANDEIWKNQEKWILKSWNFYENCGVHILELEDGTEFHMLAERRYPLTKETLERMLALGLIADSESEAVFDLFRFIQKQINELHQELVSPEQMASGKDFSNPLMADTLAIPEQTANGKETSNPFIAAKEFQVYRVTKELKFIKEQIKGLICVWIHPLGVNNITLNDVLDVPEYTDLKVNKILGIGRQFNGLYLFDVDNALSHDINQGNDDSEATSMDDTNNTHPEGIIPNETDFITDFYENSEFNFETEELPANTLRRSSRQTKLPSSLNDFIVEGKVKYGVEKVVNYANLNHDNYCVVSALNKSVEPTCYEEAILDSNWIDAMNAEI
ncbi:hypothetical protein Tco_0533182 [Tanacetum coccineum]